MNTLQHLLAVFSSWNPSDESLLDGTYERLLDAFLKVTDKNGHIQEVIDFNWSKFGDELNALYLRERELKADRAGK